MSNQPTKRPMPEAVIFDLDGTLVSSNLDFRTICEQAGCVPGQDILRYMETLPLEERSRVSQIIHDHEMADALSCEVLPGVKAMLKALELKNIRMAIVTRNSASATQIKLARTGIALKHVITREDAPPKPAPDALINLAKQWGIEQKSCVYVGDYIYDIEAAHRANMHAALYSDASLPDFADQAHFVFRHHDEFEEVLMDYWHSLAF
ncbi:MAG: HAD superfamily hydrolase (TIGR01509 family) [Oleiphilaceae bacterium]|jgi:HAD superfamily hydrolase (TIGR01509 family)